MLLTVLWFEAALYGIKHLGGGDRRRRADSDLHGRAALLDRRFMRRLARRRSILLGHWGARPNAPLIGWSLESACGRRLACPARLFARRNSRVSPRSRPRSDRR